MSWLRRLPIWDWCDCKDRHPRLEGGVMAECRFVQLDGVLVGHCLIHGTYTSAALCTHAAAELERRLEAQASNIKLYQTEVARLEEQVEELLGLAGMDKERIARLEEEKAQLAERIVVLEPSARNYNRERIRADQAEARTAAMRARCSICYGAGSWTSKEGAEIPCEFCIYKIDVKQDGTWLVLQGERKAAIRLESTVNGPIGQMAVADVRAALSSPDAGHEHNSGCIGTYPDCESNVRRER